MASGLIDPLPAVSPVVIGCMPYEDYAIRIYEHKDNSRMEADSEKNKYFYFPVVQLLEHETICIFNKDTEETKVEFQIEMWNEEVQIQVVEFIRSLTGKPVNPSGVSVLWFEKAKLMSSPSSPFKVFKLSEDWIPYSLSKSMKFSVHCFSPLHGQQLMARGMPYIPKEYFSQLCIMFSFKVQTSHASSEIRYRIGSIPSGDFATILLNRFPVEEEILLTKKDMERLLTESTAKMIEKTFGHSDIPSSQTSNSPTKETKKDKFKISDEMDLSGVTFISKEELDKLYDESKDYVEWDGQKFVTKPLTLYQINLSKLREIKPHDEIIKQNSSYSTCDDIIIFPIQIKGCIPTAGNEELCEPKSKVMIVSQYP